MYITYTRALLPDFQISAWRKYATVSHTFSTSIQVLTQGIEYYDLAISMVIGILATCIILLPADIVFTVHYKQVIYDVRFQLPTIVQRLQAVVSTNTFLCINSEHKRI